MKTELKLEYDFCGCEQEGIPAIIVAAGNSSRMNGTNKQLIELLGVPVIVRTLLAFEKSPVISRIILVVRDQDVYSLQLLAEKYNISKLSDIVCGGDCRLASVLKGFERLCENEQKVLIHDGARPLVSQRIICEVAKALETATAAVCGVKVKDTLKRVDQNGNIIKTVDRESLFAVQTPQGVRKNEFLNAAKEVSNMNSITDDMAVMESAGHSCIMIEGSYQNIKITTREDIPLAEIFLKENTLCE